MKATMMHPGGTITLEERPDPTIRRPTDAVVRVTAAAVCGSDLWRYRGVTPVPDARPIGHEFVGVVEAVGEQVRTLHPGDFVVAPFRWSDNTCPECRYGVQPSCRNGGNYGAPDREGLPVDGGQGEAVRVPLADGTLIKVVEHDENHLPSLLALTDVMATGWHAAVSARVGPGATAVVIGDGAVGLCAVLAASRMGAHRVIAMSRHEPRQRLARAFGATDIVAERGADGEAAIAELTGGLGPDSVLECVGSAQSMQTAFGIVRPGGVIGFVGVPHEVELPAETIFGRNLTVAGGIAPAREYLPRLLDLVLDGEIEPGRVFDLELPLAEVGEAYRAMDERRAIKSLLRVPA